MMRKVLSVLFVYLFLMIVVSLSSDIISMISNEAETQNESPFNFFVNVITEAGEKTAVYKTYPIYQAEPHDLITAAADVTVTSPFGFAIKITEENEEEQPLLHFYSSIGILTNYNYVEEIEKRKIKLWYKRKFALCMIKNRIKRESGKTYSLSLAKEVKCFT